MKKVFVTVTIYLCLLPFLSNPQNSPDSIPLSYNIHSRGDASISLSGNRLMNDPFGSQFAGGVKIRMFLGRRVSFDTDLAFGKDYVHFGPGIIGLPLWILGAELGFSSDEDGSFGWFLFELATMALSAEHIAFHFPVKNNTDISPFISILRFKQLQIDDINVNPEDNYAHASFVAGLELNQYFKRFVLSPYAEYNIAYDGYFRGFNFGVNFGYYIPVRKSK
jgi:hypothetical protein